MFPLLQSGNIGEVLQNGADAAMSRVQAPVTPEHSTSSGTGWSCRPARGG